MVVMPMGRREDQGKAAGAVPERRPPTANEQLLGQLARGTEPNPTVDPARDLAELERKLDRCLAGLAMHFQPIVHANTRARFAYEALLRSGDKSLPHPG